MTDLLRSEGKGFLNSQSVNSSLTENRWYRQGDQRITVIRFDVRLTGSE